MFSRWGAFVYRFRRPVALFAVVIAIASGVLATQTSSALSAGGWLDADSESADVSARLDTEFGAGKSSIIALFRSRRPARTRPPPSSRARSRRPPPASPATPHVSGIIGYAETGDTRFISTAGDAAYIVIQLDVTDEESVDVVDDIRAGDRAAGRLHLPADRLRPDHQGLGRAVREGPPEGRARLAPDRRARPDPGLRLDRRGRDAAARRRPGDPQQPRAHLPRRPAGRDEHLRAQHRDDARARAGDRLLAVHRQPLPRGAAARPDRRRGGRAGRRHRRQGRRVQRHRGRHRAVRAAAVRGPGDPLDRHRGRARRRSARSSSP